MKNIIVIIMLSLIFSCNAQNTKIMIPTLDNKFETIDDSLYQKIKDKNSFNEYDLGKNYTKWLNKH